MLRLTWTLALIVAAQGLKPNVTVPLFGDVDVLGYVYVKATTEEEVPVFDKDGNVIHRGNVFRMVVDTGSTLTYLPCTGCTEYSCGALRVENLLNQKHETIETRCSDLMCPAPSRTCEATEFGQSDSCWFDVKFPDESSLRGEFAMTRLNISTFQSWLPIGCANEIKGAVREQLADGSLGLAAESSFLSLSANGWSLCLAPAGFFGGTLTLGKELAFDDATWISTHQAKPSGENPWAGAFRMNLAPSAFSLGGKKSTKTAFAQVNTGSPLTWFPSDLFKDARTLLFAACAEQQKDGSRKCGGNKRVTGDSQALACFDLSASSLFKSQPAAFSASAGAKDLLALHDFFSREFPTISLAIPGVDSSGAEAVQEVDFKPKEYLYRLRDTDSTWCVGVMEDTRAGSSDIIVGVNVLRGWKVSFDKSRKALSMQMCEGEFTPSSEAPKDASDRHVPLEDNSQSAKAGAGGFMTSFVLTLGLLCCSRRMCGSTDVSYEALDGFGSGAAGAQGFGDVDSSHTKDVEMARHFSIATTDDEDEMESLSSSGVKNGGSLSSDDEDDFPIAES